MGLLDHTFPWSNQERDSSFSSRIRRMGFGANLDSNNDLRFYRAVGVNQKVAVFEQADTTNNGRGVDVVNAGTGTSVFIDNNGNGVSLDIDSEATTVDVVDIQATTLTTGTALDIDVAALTTGKGIDMSGTAAITTGRMIDLVASGTTQTTGILLNVESAATSMTGAGRLLYVNQTGASTSSGGGIIAEVVSAATDATTVMRVNNAGTGTELDVLNTNAGATGAVINLEQQSASAANDDVAGRIQFTADDGSSVSRVIGKMDISWTDVTTGTATSDFAFFLMNSTVDNEAFKCTAPGVFSVDDDGGGADDPVSLFDD